MIPMLLVWIILFTSNCNQHSLATVRWWHEQTFENQLDAYRDITGRNPYHVKVVIKDELDPEDPNIVGYCTIAKQEISIQFAYWKATTPTMRELLIFHELGHCDMGQEHRDAKFADGCPASIMSTVLMNEKCYKLHKPQLIQELKRNIRF